LHEWWEKPTDRRILSAALAYLAEEVARPSKAMPGRGTAQDQQLATSSRSNGCSVGTAAPTRPASTTSLSLGRLGQCQLAHGQPLEDRASVFVAHVAFPVRSEKAARAAIAQIKMDSKAASATHNISAFSVDGPSLHRCGCDDDGEERAGTKLLNMLTQKKASDVAVVVLRWYGGTNIGKARFEHICGTAQRLLDACGHCPGTPMQERPLGQGRQLHPESAKPTPSAADRRELMAAAAERRAASSSGAVVRGVGRVRAPTSDGAGASSAQGSSSARAPRTAENGPCTVSPPLRVSSVELAADTQPPPRQDRTHAIQRISFRAAR